MSLVRKIGRRLRDIDLVVPSLIERRLLDSHTPSQEGKISLPLLAIVGPPRVGSTLISQLLVSRYQFYYFNNFQHAFLRYPYLAYRISKRFVPERSVLFRSDHGFEKGIGGLSEGIFFWAFWFDMPVTQKEPQPRAERIQHVRRVLDQIYTDTGRPLLTAANTLSFYLSELHNQFDTLIVVNMRREPVANALSLLRGRQQHRASVNEWWSIRPAECVHDADTDAYHQVACQIVETYRQIQRQREMISSVPIIDVSYEDLCTFPQDILARIEQTCLDASFPLIPRQTQSALPELSARGPRQGERDHSKRFEELFAGIQWDELWT